MSNRHFELDYMDIKSRRYYDVEVRQRGKKTEGFVEYGSLEEIVSSFDLAMDGLGIEDYSKASADISYCGVPLVHADSCESPSDFELLDSVRVMAEVFDI